MSSAPSTSCTVKISAMLYSTKNGANACFIVLFFLSFFFFQTGFLNFNCMTVIAMLAAKMEVNGNMCVRVLILSVLAATLCLNIRGWQRRTHQPSSSSAPSLVSGVESRCSCWCICVIVIIIITTTTTALSPSSHFTLIVCNYFNLFLYSVSILNSAFNLLLNFATVLGTSSILCAY